MHKIINIGSELIENEEKFLLVNANHEPLKGQWNNPGGKPKTGEAFEQCAIREIFEETGLTVKHRVYQANRTA
jgi:8-oxo-dGTP diphosphatase